MQGKVFVHCVKGISRSPAICVAYLLWRNQSWSLQKALQIVKKSRPIINPNPGFMFQWMEWQQQLAQQYREQQLLQLQQQEQGGGPRGSGTSAALSGAEAVAAEQAPAPAPAAAAAAPLALA